MESGTQQPFSVLQIGDGTTKQREKKEANLHFRLSPSEIYSWNEIVRKENLSGSNTFRKLIGLYSDLLKARQIVLAFRESREKQAQFESLMQDRGNHA